MNLASINLNLLVALDALLAEAHVGRAASRIGLSQPAASHALKQLRELFGDSLLVRVGTRMQLTPRARTLRELLPETLRRIDSLLLANSFDPAKSSRRFRVMLHDHVASLLVPALVTRLQKEAPGVRLDVLPWRNPVSLNTERASAIDAFVSCTTRQISGFQRELLFKDTESTVCRRGHPSALRLKTLRAFLKAKHVAVVGRGMAEDPVDEWLGQENFRRNVVLRVPNYIQALQVVSETDLVAFVPKRLAQSLAGAMRFIILPPPIDPGEYEEGVFYPLRALQDPASIWMRKLMREVGRQFAAVSMSAATTRARCSRDVSGFKATRLN
jgi:DNA-binding transcriptional LysR family regulator